LEKINLAYDFGSPAGGQNVTYLGERDTTVQYHSLDIRKLRFNRMPGSDGQLTARANTEFYP